MKIADIPRWLLPAPTSIGKECVSGFGHLLPHHPVNNWTCPRGFYHWLLDWDPYSDPACICFPERQEALYPLLILSQNVPIIVLAPLLVIWFGFGLLPKIIVITLVCFFPVTIAGMGGFRNTPPDMKHYMLMAGATKTQLFSKLEWPSALPALFSGLKIAATYSVMGAVISEWLGAKKGIGVYMTLASSSFRTDRVFVAIFVIMALSLLFFGLITAGEKRLIKWERKAD